MEPYLTFKCILKQKKTKLIQWHRCMWDFISRSTGLLPWSRRYSSWKPFRKRGDPIPARVIPREVRIWYCWHSTLRGWNKGVQAFPHSKLDISQHPHFFQRVVSYIYHQLKRDIGNNIDWFVILLVTGCGPSSREARELTDFCGLISVGFVILTIAHCARWVLVRVDTKCNSLSLEESGSECLILRSSCTFPLA